MRNLSTALLLPALLVLAACSGKTVIGSVEGTLKKNPDGGATGTGSDCNYGGKTAQLGESFIGPDGCNTCKCAAEGAFCTEMACVADGGSGDGCAYGTQFYAVGASFKCDDGCNTCTCTKGGSVIQTEMACVNNCSAPGACKGPAPGMPSILCSDGSTAGPTCTDVGGTCGWNITSCTCKDSFGTVHQSGDTWDDGCNTCTCSSNGSAACTKKACVCPAPGTTIDCMPMVPPERQNLCSGPYHDFIGKNCPGVVFAL